MAVDFSIGALIGIIVPGAVARKVASNEAKNPVLDETRNSHIMVIMEVPIKLIIF